MLPPLEQALLANLVAELHSVVGAASGPFLVVAGLVAGGLALAALGALVGRLAPRPG
jgi:hypothetical protein